MKRFKSELAAMGDLLRHTLKCKQLSHRAVQRRACEILQKQPGQKAQTMGSTIRVKLRKGEEWRLSYEELLLILEAAEIDTAEFFATLAKVGKLSLAVFGPIKTDHWNQDQKKILSKVAKVEEKGSRGYLEARAELKSIELLRDEDPAAAEAAAWAFLQEHREPGALVGALAILAMDASSPNAYRLLELAFGLLGPDHSNAAGARLLTAMGLCLFRAARPQEAVDVLQRFALPVVGVYGDLDDHALALLYLALSAADLGQADLNRASLEKIVCIGSDRMRFAALQLLAFQVLNLGEVSAAMEMYGELVRLPYFEFACPLAKVNIRWSHMTARFLAGCLTEAEEPSFREILAEAFEILDTRSQVAISLDYVLFLRSLGKLELARDILEANLWKVMSLEDPEVQRKFAQQWEGIGLPDDSRLSTLVNRSGSKPLQPRPLASRLCLGRIPRLPAEDPKE